MDKTSSSSSLPRNPLSPLEMDRLSVHQKTPKEAKAKKKPIKVVYISSPMKVKTSAADFRALVQELTGQDSDIADNMVKYPTIESADEVIDLGSDPRLVRSDTGAADHTAELLYQGVASPFEMFHVAFPPHMLEDFPGFMPPSHFYNPQGGAFQNFDGL